jgi:hypothetical protein
MLAACSAVIRWHVQPPAGCMLLVILLICGALLMLAVSMSAAC